ncbi:MAG TPA: sigma-70 family RNA polymerase sigma factor [Verrucomicrobiae bacterium]|jgi:RNA polymerase sigma factor (TIGR02999 family)
MSDITQTLEGILRGDPNAADRLLPLVYEELRRLAAARMALETPGQTLQPTALVHEAWVRLTGGDNRKWNDRTHFFAAAAEAMRRILVDNARRKRAARHGGGQLRVEMPEIAAASAPDDDQLLALNDALEKFAIVSQQKAELVKLRYFVGMTTEEAAQALGISVPTASRYWTYARAWLADEIRAQQRQ